MKTLLIALASIAGFAASAAQVSAVKVKTLDSFGGDVGSIVSRCQTKVGQTYDPVVVSRDVNALKDADEFEDIHADAERTEDGVSVTFTVRRKLRYKAPLKVVGCSALSESKVATEAGLRDGYLYGEGDLAAAAGRVVRAYQKKHFPYAKVVPSAERLGAGSDCEVTFTVTEGARMKIRDIVFTGAESVAEVEAGELHSAIGDFPWWNPSGWFADSLSSDEQLEQCVPKIEEVFRDHGFLDVRVDSPRRLAVEDDEEKCDVEFHIRPGMQYKVGKVSISGLTRYPEEAVKGKSYLPQAGDVAGAKMLEEAAHRVKVVVGSGDSGLADTLVTVRRLPNAEDSTAVDLDFQVKEGVPVVIDDVLVRGNDYTKDKVIRREIDLGPGDRMLEDRAERSQRRLENLGYFSRVSYKLEPSDRAADAATGAEYRNLVYDVEEKNTGSFMVGIGASSVDSVYISAEVSQSNFDLFAPQKFFRGGGQKGRLYAAWGPRYQTVEASIVEPHLFDRLLELSVDGYRRMRWYDEYDLIRSGASVGLSYPMKVWNPRQLWDDELPAERRMVPFGRFGMRYTAEYVEFDDPDDNVYTFDNRPVSVAGEDDEYGGSWESVVRLFWSRDSRDNFRMPTSGSRSQLFFDISAGGDVQFWRAGFSHRSYIPLWRQVASSGSYMSWVRDHVFMVALRAETIDALTDEVPIFERMFLGGPRSIRGVKYRNVAPFATRGGTGIPWGGQTLFCMNFEYTVPIVKMLRAAVFSDLGSVGQDCFDLEFSDTFAWTVGVGLRIDIPMFPIRLDFATPFKKPDEADEEVFSFTVGYEF